MYETVDFFPLSAFPLRTILAPPILPRPLHAALWAKDEESAMVLLLDGGDDPNEVDGVGRGPPLGTPYWNYLTFILTVNVKLCIRSTL